MSRKVRVIIFSAFFIGACACFGSGLQVFTGQIKEHIGSAGTPDTGLMNIYFARKNEKGVD